MRDEAHPATALLAMRKIVLIGVLIISIFFGGLGGWAAVAPLHSAAIAPGVIGVESKRKTIQHLEGGIVADIKVSEGQRVMRGTPLIVLDPTQARASLKQLKARYHAALALQARLTAERDEAETIVFPKTLRDAHPKHEIQEAMAGEVRIFKARQKALDARAAVIKQRIAQFEEEIAGLKGQIAAEGTQLKVIGLERDGERKLLDRKLTGMQRFLELRRDEAEVAGSRSRNVAEVARVKQSIAEERLKIMELGTQQMNEVVSELRETETLIFDLKERLAAAGDVLARTRILAPLDGVVVDLQVHTVGGVIAPGEPLMDIVPNGESLIVNARVTPEDIDSVHPGLSAEIHITAFNRRDVPPVTGRVRSVSADRLDDERTGAPYFLALVELPQQPYPERAGLDIYPGMQAEVMIVTGEQTPLQYLVRPALRSFDRSLREN